MVFHGTAVLAIRSGAGRSGDEVVVLTGPPLWQLALEARANELVTQWKRLIPTRPFATNEPLSTHDRLSAHDRLSTNEPKRGSK